MKDRFAVRIERSVRPLRFAFIVNAADASAVRRACEWNTLFWGGRLNAVIPLFSTPPRGWPPRHERRQPRLEAIAAAHGYIDAFEPDYVIEMEAGLTEPLNLPKWLVKKESNLAYD